MDDARHRERGRLFREVAQDLSLAVQRSLVGLRVHHLEYEFLAVLGARRKFLSRSPGNGVRARLDAIELARQPFGLAAPTRGGSVFNAINPSMPTFHSKRPA